jgi:hypothetical protein
MSEGKSRRLDLVRLLLAANANVNARMPDVRIPTKSPTYSEMISPTIPISSRPPFRNDLARCAGASLAVKI